MSTPGYWEVEHTADVSLGIRGRQLDELFRCAAQGLFALLRPQPAGPCQPIQRSVILEALDSEALLVDWLAELLYLVEAERARLDRFEFLSIDSRHLHARCSGAAPCRPERSIKAVTFHNLRIARNEAGMLEATITFDL